MKTDAPLLLFEQASKWYGSVLALNQVTLELTGGPAVIDRYDRSRNINFEIDEDDNTYLGLFYDIYVPATVMNLTLTGSVQGDDTEYVGALAV